MLWLKRDFRDDLVEYFLNSNPLGAWHQYHPKGLKKKSSPTRSSRASLVVQWVRNLLAVQETQQMQVQSLGQEDPPEDGMATYSSVLAWRIPWTEEPGGLLSMGLQRVRCDWIDLACTQAHRALEILISELWGARWVFIFLKSSLGDSDDNPRIIDLSLCFSSAPPPSHRNFFFPKQNNQTNPQIQAIFL